MIQAITNQTVALQVLAELIVGYMLPGRPVAMMIFKTFSFISLTQAIAFLGDLKIGHYMKIPPRPMFWCQVCRVIVCVKSCALRCNKIVATIVAGTVQLGVENWMFANIP